MAEENKAIEWPGGANVADDFDFLMVGKNGQPIMKIPKDKLNEVIVINGEGIKAVAGGASSATPTILAPGPAGQNRKMEDVTGWFVNGTGNPLVAVGEPWEAPDGFKNTNWWDGTAGTWSLGSSVPLPTTAVAPVVVQGGEEATSQDAVWNFGKPTQDKVNGIVTTSSATTPVTGSTVGVLAPDNTVDSSQANWTTYLNKDKGDATHVHYIGNCPFNGKSTLLGIKADNSIVKLIPDQTIGKVLNMTVAVPSDVIRVSGCARNITGDTFTLEFIKDSYLVSKDKVQGLTVIESNVNTITAMTTNVPFESVDVPASSLVVGGLKQNGTVDASLINWRTFADIDVTGYNQVEYEGTTPNNSNNNATIVGKRADNSVLVLRTDTVISNKKFTVIIPAGIVKLSAGYRAAEGDIQKLKLQKTTQKFKSNSVITPLVTETTDDAAFMGDSITKNGDGTGTLKGYQLCLNDLIKFSALRTFAYRGYPLAAREGTTNSIIQQRQSWVLANINVLLAGTNDFRLSIPIGDFTADYVNGSGNNYYTFYGALRVYVEYVLSQKPNSKNLFITPPPRDDRDDGGYYTHDVNAAGHTQVDYRNATIKVGEYESIPVVDLTCAFGIGWRTIKQWTSDGLHPLDPMYLLMAQGIYPKLLPLVKR